MSAAKPLVSSLGRCGQHVCRMFWYTMTRQETSTQKSSGSRMFHRMCAGGPARRGAAGAVAARLGAPLGRPRQAGRPRLDPCPPHPGSRRPRGTSAAGCGRRSTRARATRWCRRGGPCRRASGRRPGAGAPASAPRSSGSSAARATAARSRRGGPACPWRRPAGQDGQGCERAALQARQEWSDANVGLPCPLPWRRERERRRDRLPGRAHCRRAHL